jgi:hypothetical protein
MGRAWIALCVVAVSLNAGCSSADDGAGDEDGVAGDNGDDSSEDELRGGEQLTASAVAALVRQVGFPSNMVGRMVCTAKWESSFYTRSTNKNHNGTTDRGLFQINSIHMGHTKNCPSSSSAIFDPLTNTRCALSIYKMQGINAWYGYKAHRSECDRYHVHARPLVPGVDDLVDVRDDLPPEPISDADMYGEGDEGDENASFGERPEGSLDLLAPAPANDLPGVLHLETAQRFDRTP